MADAKWCCYGCVDSSGYLAPSHASLPETASAHMDFVGSAPPIRNPVVKTWNGGFRSERGVKSLLGLRLSFLELACWADEAWFRARLSWACLG